MNKFLLSTSLIVSLLYGLQSSHVYAMEEVKSERSQKSSTGKYKDFEGLSDEQYIEKCIPKLDAEKKKSALKVFKSVMKDGHGRIKEDGVVDSLENNGKILPEGGYSYAPQKEVQGPFLEYCGTGKFKHILDIGSGNGNDAICMILTGNAQVIAVDIHTNQLNELKQRAEENLKGEFPELLEKRRVSILKRNFAEKATKVPPDYLGKFQGANLSRVLHFLDGEQTKTLLCNVACMLEKEALISIAVFGIKPGSDEETWFNMQKQEGLKDPGLLYYKVIKKIRKDPNFGMSDYMKPGQYVQVKRDEKKLPAPGYKREFMDIPSKGMIMDHSLEQGRFYHTLESLKEYLDPHFKILDFLEWDSEVESNGQRYLSVIAQKKS